MATLTYDGEVFTVDHAVKGVDYIHGYDANGVLVVAFDGVEDFAGFEYDGTYMEPTVCLTEHYNTVRRCGNVLKSLDGTELLPIIPKLTDEQKAAMYSLMTAYYNNRSLFGYDWNTTRNYYANNRCWNSDWGRFRLCCTAFAELVWMGRDVADFTDGDTYKNGITPAFDWGYYFQYKDRANMGGVAKRDDSGAITGYYKYRQPLGTDEYSYSVNTKYSAELADDENYPNAQRFNGFMMANDMAKELYNMGCEIPFDALEQGDLVFIGDTWSESVNEHLFIQNTRFRGITHVAMVYKVVDGVLVLIDCTDDYFDTDAGTGLSILTCREDHGSEMSTRARAIEMLGNVVMCARHPAAWGKNNMSDTDSIDFMTMAYTDGLTAGRAIPFGESLQGMTVTEGLWYVNVADNRLGVATGNAQVMKWSDTAFETRYSNAT